MYIAGAVSMKHVQEETTMMKNRKHTPNAVLVARQIDGLRQVMRRMKASSQSLTLDPVISSKLEQFANS